MDIKDFILIGGGLLIAAVVAHGFWIAWRERRQDLRIDIKPDLIPDEMDEIDRLRGELPNGGGRVVDADEWDPQQDLLDLEAPPALELEPTEAPADSMAGRIEPAMGGSVVDPEPAREAFAADTVAHEDGAFREDTATPVEPIIETIDDSDYAVSASDDYSARNRSELETPASETPALDGRSEPVMADAGTRARVAEVELPEALSPEALSPEATLPEAPSPEPIVTEESKRPRRLGGRRDQARAQRTSARKGQAEEAAATKREPTAIVPVEELIVLNVLAEPARPYTGDELFAALRTCGLKFGDMNIFHRVEPLTKAIQYSVASAVEPGTFDMADMEAIRCPGLCLFMQLPGPEEPIAAFEDLLSVARSVTGSLGGELKDEHRNVMTPQTVEHYRQRIVDFSRRRMSKRA